MSTLKEITTALAELDEELTLAKVQEALAAKTPGQEILKSCRSQMTVIGKCTFRSCCL
jgi:hypothetical protein